MKKSNLKSGMLFEFTDGRLAVVMLNHFCGEGIILYEDKRGYDYLRYWEEGLISAPGYNVETVNAVFEQKYYTTESLFVKGNLLWERKEEKVILNLDGIDYSETTLRSIIKKSISI